LKHRDNRTDPVTKDFMRRRMDAAAIENPRQRAAYQFSLDVLEPIARRYAQPPHTRKDALDASADIMIVVASILATVLMTIRMGNREEAVELIDSTLAEIKPLLERAIQDPAAGYSRYEFGH
jgi:hypothetical protein